MYNGEHQTSTDVQREAQRLESLWSGQFGDAYTQRNANAGAGRENFWRRIVEKCAPQRVLEVGCNLGANLRPLAQLLPPREVFGIDINETALFQLRSTAPNLNALWSPARDLPFKDNSFDLVFTTGVLIHQPEASLLQVMGEIVRCSRRYILCGEYFSEQTVEVPYREQSGALFKRPYGELYQIHFPHLKLVDSESLGQNDGWDDVTFWLFEKT